MPRSTIVLYRSVEGTALLTTLASASAQGGPLHAHGPALHGPAGSEAAETIEAVATSHGSHPLIWDGDAPTDAPGVHRLARELGAELLVCEWDPAGHGQDLARALLADPPCDVLVVRPGPFAAIESIVVGAGEGPNAPIVADLARHWGRVFDVPVSLIRVTEDVELVERSAALCIDLGGTAKIQTPVDRDVVSVLAAVGRSCGFLALGAAEGVPLDEERIQTLATRVAARCDTTVVVARRGTAR